MFPALKHPVDGPAHNARIGLFGNSRIPAPGFRFLQGRKTASLPPGSLAHRTAGPSYRTGARRTPGPRFVRLSYPLPGAVFAKRCWPGQHGRGRHVRLA